MTMILKRSIIGRAGASPPSRATGAKIIYIYIYTCDRVTLTVISISPSRVTSRACAQSLCSLLRIELFYNMDSKGVRATTTSKFRLNRAKGGALSETSTCLAKTMRQSYAIQRPCCPPVNSLLSAVFNLLS